MTTGITQVTVSVIDLNCPTHLHGGWEVGEWWGQRTLALGYLSIHCVRYEAFEALMTVQHCSVKTL